jgi:site-specific recombinase XerD
MSPSAIAERVTCSSCRAELVDGACPTHGPRNADGTSPYRTNRGRTFKAEVLSRDEVRTLLAQCSDSDTGTRNAAMLATLWRTGCRVSELLALRAKDIDRAAGTLTILRGKGNRRRVVAIDAEGVARIDLWLARRKALGISAHRPVFCSLRGRPLPASYLRELLPRLAAKAGIEKRTHPHGFRHALAHEMVMNGIPLTIIQRQLGHANANVTSTYLQHIAPGDIVKALRALPPWDEREA